MVEFPNIEAVAHGLVSGDIRSWIHLKPEAKAILLKLKELEEVAEECRDYMMERADLSWEDVPNKEMQLLAKLDAALLPMRVGGDDSWCTCKGEFTCEGHRA